MNLAKKCSRKNCEHHPEYYRGREYFCERHYRFLCMKSGASANKKYIPSWHELERLLQCLRGMRCPTCDKIMIWHSKHDGGKRSKVVSLQHNINKTISLICYSCNCGHGHSNLGDKYFDIPYEHKYCPICMSILHINNFYRKSTKSNGLQSKCKKCDNFIRKQNKLKKKHKI